MEKKIDGFRINGIIYFKNKNESNLNLFNTLFNLFLQENDLNFMGITIDGLIEEDKKEVLKLIKEIKKDSIQKD